MQPGADVDYDVFSDLSVSDCGCELRRFSDLSGSI